MNEPSRTHRCVNKTRGSRRQAADDGPEELPGQQEGGRRVSGVTVQNYYEEKGLKSEGEDLRRNDEGCISAAIFKLQWLTMKVKFV